MKTQAIRIDQKLESRTGAERSVCLMENDGVLDRFLALDERYRRKRVQAEKLEAEFEFALRYIESLWVEDDEAKQVLVKRMTAALDEFVARHYTP